MADAREISILVRDALLLYEQYSNQKTDTLIDELEKEAKVSFLLIGNLIDSMARQRRLWITNNMSQILADSDMDIGGSFTKERWLEIEEAFNAFEQWLFQPLPISGVASVVILSRREVPAKKTVIAE